MTDLPIADRLRRLNRWALQSAARDLMPREGVAFCLRRLAFDPETGRYFSGVRLMYSPQVKRAHYKNLFICGSVWMCPICAAKVSERRRVELSQALENSEFQTAMVSLTLQHSKDDRLSDLLGALLSARHSFKRGRAWKSFVRDFGIVGTISSLETTYGVNGWHPHFHTLLVARRPLDDDAIRERLYPVWLAGLSDRDRSASYDRGLMVTSKQKQIADYIAKFGREPQGGKVRWTLAHELTKSVSKLSRGESGLTPLELLRGYLYGDHRAGKLWQEYATAFKRRHQLQWSRGLRSMLGLGKSESDLEVAKRVEEPSFDLVPEMSRHQWQVLLSNDVRGELLEVAYSGDPAAVQTFLEQIGVLEK